jgi:hypothetical protein
MISPHSGTSRGGWLPALLLSLLFHGGLVLPCLMLPSPGPWGTGTGSSLLDTRVRTQKMEVGILIYESELPPRTAARTSSQAQPAVSPNRPSAPIPARETMPSPKSDSPVAILQPGENEQQEESARTSPAGDSQGNGTGPGGGTISFFEIPTEAQAIVYVIDRSASMGPSGALAAAKRELLASLSRLPPTARFQVIAYSSRVEPIPI